MRLQIKLNPENLDATKSDWSVSPNSKSLGDGFSKLRESGARTKKAGCILPRLEAAKPIAEFLP